jgi:hypothetical protein
MDPKKVAMKATGSTIIKLFNNGLPSDDKTAWKGSRVRDEEGTRTGVVDTAKLLLNPFITMAYIGTNHMTTNMMITN